MDNSQLVTEIDEQIESLRDSIGWAHDNINECQTNIVHLEESKVCCHSVCESTSMLFVTGRAIFECVRVLSLWVTR